MTPDEAKQQAMAYAVSQPGWKWFERPGIPVPYAGRQFEYPGRSGGESLLSLRAGGHGKRGSLIAQLNMRFSAGAEAEFEGSLPGCVAWLSKYTKRLEVPYALHSCKTMAEAKYHVELLSSEALFTLAAVFDLDFGKGREYVEARLVAMFAPAGAPELLKTFVEGRSHWKLAQDVQGKSYRAGDWYAWRLINVLDQSYHLRIRPSSDTPHGTKAWSLVAFTEQGDEVAAMVGDHGETVAEILGIEKALSVIEELRACKTSSKAWYLMTSVRGDRLDMVRQACGLPSAAVDKVRASIIKHVTGMVVDPARVSA